MKKSTLISLIALLVAVAGVLIALAAYFKKKKETLVDDFDDELLYDDLEDEEYYEAHLEDECCDCGCCACEEECEPCCCGNCDDCAPEEEVQE
ncbi:MAG: hypothetical protein J6A26_04400 [Oscillospiraceae bacterium]|nr:hypothetical protein [Oscillospiraceae bacterium]